uniref:Uncharacterized protein n=1 Tax=Ditylenchus dipsaci TaxID=166011 RepID=A0A915CMT8_9BILA
MQLLLPILFVSLISLLNAFPSSDSAPSSGQEPGGTHNKQAFKKKMLDDFHDIMAKVVANWNELGKSVNQVADNIDNNLDPDGNYPGKPWPVALSSILLENVNVQLRSVIVQIAEGLLRINKKKRSQQGPPPPQSSSSPEGSSEDESQASGSRETESSAPHPHGHGGFDLSKLASMIGHKPSESSNQVGEAKSGMTQLAALLSLMSGGQPQGHHGGQNEDDEGARGVDLSSIKHMLSKMTADKDGYAQDNSSPKMNVSQLAAMLASSMGGKNQGDDEE